MVLIDIVTVNISFFLSLLILYDMKYSLIDKTYLNIFISYAIPNTLVTIVIYYFSNLYRIVLEYISYNEVKKILKAVLLSVVIHYIGVNIFFDEMPISYFIIGFLFQYILSVTTRFFKRIIIRSKNKISDKDIRFKKAIIIGAGSAGELLKEDIIRSNINNDIKINVIAFIDDDPDKKGKLLGDTLIIGGRECIHKLVYKENVDLILVAIPSAREDQFKEILKICNETKCEVKVLPGIYQLISGKVSISKMKDISIEDLLGRQPVELFNNESFDYLNGKVVLVTGGGGSIGSELCRQIALYRPKLLIIFDIYENNAYEIEQELKRKYYNLNLITLIGSVRDYNRLKQIFDKYQPEIVFHAAAHKHVPLMEASPVEAIKNNIRGTYILGILSLIYNVKRFVLISTDKAVNPTSIMGATKRVCEKIIQGLNEVRASGDFCKLSKISVNNGDKNIFIDPEYELKSKLPKTEFVAVRFGNVLGSNGSVIPLFQEQIEEGGPVTVTHPDIIRYFMTIKEAVKLVLQAGAIANGGEIFVLDMGDPVKIDDLARQLIRLSGYEPDVDIKIVYTGLRPGEKLYEEKLMDEECIEGTENKKIAIGRPLKFSKDEFFENLEKIINAENIDDIDVEDCINSLITTYIGTKK